ncbi:flagellar FliJ protein [Azospira sp. I13]|uniref:flagellar export protein FliJ n=1 Tax=Azospira sp. I13 TaxID=1765050 RepID=UPI000D44DC19|nr:flagellar export protein FliJ [Azospira sp. I13]GBG00710.1 flagellar FliJ protein [Azospira sp. I13]
MTKPFTLQPLLELMQTRADDATKELGRRIAAEQDTKAKLNMLVQYRDEYAERFRQAAGQGLSPASWRNFQEFIGRIDEAIAQQRVVVLTSEQHTAEGQAQWLTQHHKLKAIDTLAHRHLAAEAAREQKQEQKQQDEFSARKRLDERPDGT